MGQAGEARPESRLALRWGRAVAALADARLRAGYLRSELEGQDQAEVAEALDELAAAAERGEVAGHDVVAAALPALADELLVSWRQALCARALEHPWPALSRLLGPGQAPAAGSTLALDEAPPSAPGGRPLTLGERRAMARRASRPTLDLLMRDGHPMVVRALLETPRLTEDDVVRMAARRPVSPRALTEIARHPRWPLRPRVRLALVCNPSTPVSVALPLVPLLRQAELAHLVVATDVPAALRRAARELARSRTSP
jgi:hypothetical protein